MLEPVIDNRGFDAEGAGVTAFAGSDRSETGGDGGVGASEAADEADLVGGVARVGDDAVVDGECTEIDERGRDMLAPGGVGFLR